MPVNVSLSHRALVGDALDQLFRVLGPYVEARMRAAYGDHWLKEARAALHGRPPERWDVSDLFTLIYFKYAQAFRDMGHEGRSWVSLLKEMRKRWAHQGDLSVGETRRALETAALILRAVGAEAEAAQVENHVRELMQRELGVPLPAEPVAAADDASGGGLIGRGLRKLRRLASPPATEPLELRHAVLDEVERVVERYQDGPPFNRMVIHALAPDGQARLRFEAAFEGQTEPLRQAVLRRLAEARLPAPPQLHLSWRLHRLPPPELERRFEGRSYFVDLDRSEPAATAMLVVVQGRAKKDRYTIKSGMTVTIGRLAEVADERGRLVRRNRVAFLDYEDPSLDEAEQRLHRTISRAHARIRFDQATGAFRLFDDQSTWGTSVVREGYPVPIQVRQQPVVLQDGDLLYFGQACVRFVAGREAP